MRTINKWIISSTMAVTVGVQSQSLSRGWSERYTTYIEDNVPKSLLNIKGSQVKDLCPKYDRLTHREREKFWASLIEMISLAESNHTPTTRYRETGLGIDRVTGTHLYSEGLLQLSYVDARNWRCNFNYATDKKFAQQDSRRTIFDPFKQFDCAFTIFEGLLVRRGRSITASKGNYWSTLIPGKKGYARMSRPLRARVAGFCY